MLARNRYYPAVILLTLRNEPLCPGLFSSPSSRPFLGIGKLRASYGFVPSTTRKKKLYQLQMFQIYENIKSMTIHIPVKEQQNDALIQVTWIEFHQARTELVSFKRSNSLYCVHRVTGHASRTTDQMKRNWSCTQTQTTDLNYQKHSHHHTPSPPLQQPFAR